MLKHLLRNNVDFFDSFVARSLDEAEYVEILQENIEKIREDIAQKNLPTSPDSFICGKIEYNHKKFNLIYKNNFEIIAIYESSEKIGEEPIEARLSVSSKGGKSRFTCKIAECDFNPNPINFAPRGIGLVEHLFETKKREIKYEGLFGTWTKPDCEEDELLQNSILHIFPATLDDRKEMLKINVDVNGDNISYKIFYDGTADQKESPSVAYLNIQKNASDLTIISAKENVEVKDFLASSPQIAVAELIDNVTTDFLAEKIIKTFGQKDIDEDEIDDHKKLAKEILMSKIDFKNFKARCYLTNQTEFGELTKTEPLEIPNPHPTLRQLKEIEGDDDELHSGLRNRPDHEPTQHRAKNPDSRWIEPKDKQMAKSGSARR